MKTNVKIVFTNGSHSFLGEQSKEFRDRRCVINPPSHLSAGTKRKYIASYRACVVMLLATPGIACKAQPHLRDPRACMRYAIFPACNSARMCNTSDKVVDWKTSTGPRKEHEERQRHVLHTLIYSHFYPVRLSVAGLFIDTSCFQGRSSVILLIS